MLFNECVAATSSRPWFFKKESSKKVQGLGFRVLHNDGASNGTSMESGLIMVNRILPGLCTVGA